MSVKDENPDIAGAHHCTRENVSYTIAFLRRIQSGEQSVAELDWRTEMGIVASQLQWLLRQLDEA